MARLLYVIASLHVVLCPFTKVEESFNIQAFHDILYHRHNLSQYDHNEFPGVVPRTFVGPLIISALSAPMGAIFYLFGINKFWMQYVVRLTLALTVIAAWSRLRNTLQKQFGNTFAWWFTLITVTQYHFMYYMSRPLPNILALPLVLLAFEGWLSGKHKQFLISAGASMVIFRSELAVLFGLFLIIDLYFKKIDVKTLLKIVLPAGAGLVALTVAVDSVFWGRLLWPEAEVFWFNTVLNKSSDWGVSFVQLLWKLVGYYHYEYISKTSPFLWYLYSALPRGLGPSLLLVPLGGFLDRRVLPALAPAAVYVLLYSLLPHKELRFIIYVFPLLNMAAAAACSYIYTRRTKAPVYELLFWGTVVIVVGNVLLSVAFVSVAMTNYPGGVAMTRFHKLLKNEPYVHVHISNLAAQTGVTRFTEIHNHWQYSKNESLAPEQLQEYTHLLIEAKSKYSPNLKAFTYTHTVLESIDAFSSVSINYKLLPPIKIKTRPTLFILERKDFREYPHGHNIRTIDVAEELDTTDTIEESAEVLEIKDDANFEAIETEYLLVEEKKVDDAEQMFEAEEYIEVDARILETEEQFPFEQEVETEITDVPMEEIVIQEDTPIVEEIEISKKAKTKKAVEELKNLRKEKKRKAIAKIKSETRKEVVASAKEKLRELMKRHKHIAEELSDGVNYVDAVKQVEVDGRGDIPEEIHDTAVEEPTAEDIATIPEQEQEKDATDNVKVSDETAGTNLSVDDIVEEVIVRLIDRKIYDDKTKPEDIRAEDRQVIQQIVEEILSEKMNYTRFDQ